MYEVEIREARRIIDETSKDRATAELRAKRAEEETLKYKDKYDKNTICLPKKLFIAIGLDMKHY